MSTKNKRIALIQMSCSADTAANLDKAADRVREAARGGADVVCLPELFRAQYFCQREDAELFDLAEPIPGPSTERLTAVAKEEKVVVVASLFERRAAGLYHNTVALLQSDGTLGGIYRKMHIPDDPLYYEKFYFPPGDLGFKAFDTSVGQIGALICWDQWYPEAARITALHGANLLFYPTAIGWHPAEKEQFGKAQYEAWQTIQRSHAIANGCYVAVPNRTGHEAPFGGDGIEFWGQSFVADPAGEIIGKAGTDTEEALVVEIDLTQLELQRTHWPFLRDRRIDAYADISKRYID